MTRLNDAFDVLSRQHPEWVAIEGADEALTYGELDVLAHRFARALRAAGIAPGDRLGIDLPRSGRAVAAMLGALRAGVVYVPLDPSSPPARTRLIAQDCGLRAIFIAPELLSRWFASGDGETVEHFFLSTSTDSPVQAPSGVVVHDWAELESHDCEPLPAQPSEDDALAYILYTSGSTGVPKGVMLSHRNALAFAEWAADIVSLGAADRVASVAPFHFDLSVFDIWASMSRGARLVIVDEATVSNGRRMLDQIRAKRISVWYSVPSALMLMLEAAEERGAPCLRAVLFAGEVFPMKQLRRTMLAFPQAAFWNLFGPTETNVCAAYRVPAVPGEGEESIPIGRAACGNQLSILDERGAPVAPGEVGELFVEGPTVMLGYWDRGRRTPTRQPYATGDMVSRRRDGEIVYHGRRDHMVKIHGHRVELGEVESTLHAHPRVLEAIAFARDQSLVAVIVPGDGSLSVLDVKRHCAERLPRCMIPAEVHFVPALPRTSSGKIARLRAERAVLESSEETRPPIRFIDTTGVDAWKTT